MAEEYVIMKKSDMTTIADSVRNATGRTDGLTLSQINSEIQSCVKCATGTVTSSSDGVIHFPKIDFTPKAFIIWDVDWARDPDQEYEDTHHTTYEGFIMTAIYSEANDEWFSTVPYGSSGEIILSNATAVIGPAVYEDSVEGYWNYSLVDKLYYAYEHYVENTVFNYAIYG